eukprot:scaffold66238_cov43-Cyclotella_meneghiniana.AAC.7
MWSNTNDLSNNNSGKNTRNIYNDNKCGSKSDGGTRTLNGKSVSAQQERQIQFLPNIPQTRQTRWSTHTLIPNLVGQT